VVKTIPVCRSRLVVAYYSNLCNHSFTRAEVYQLVDILDLPLWIQCPTTRVKEDRVTALCMLLRRLAYPTRFADVEMQFGWEKSRFSRITQLTALKIWSRWKHLLRFDANRLTRSKLAEFARVIQAKGAPLDLVAALIDGTLRKNARPVRNQRLVFNGWKRIHCLKYHALISPDGLIIHIYGPVDGRRHDQTVLTQSGLSTILEQYFWTPSGEALYIYGDSGYTPGPHILSPFKGPALSAEEKQFNYRMSRIREPVEWIFKEISQQFEFLDFARSQKILLMPCGLFYMVGLLLCNAHTILHYPQISQYFNCPPPPLHEYFNGPPCHEPDLDKWCQDSILEEIDIEDTGSGDEDNGDSTFH